jgi:hypothetical protein
VRGGRGQETKIGRNRTNTETQWELYRTFWKIVILQYPFYLSTICFDYTQLIRRCLWDCKCTYEERANIFVPMDM